MVEDEAFQHIYQELRKLANAYVANSGPNQTLQPTEMVHEVYLRLLKSQTTSEERGQPAIQNQRAYFFAAAARAMRQLLVDRARRRGAKKRGGEYVMVTLDDNAAPKGLSPAELLTLHDALERLEAAHPRPAQIVLLRYFAGQTVAQIAKDLAVTPRTIERDWRFAKAWLGHALADDK